MSADASAVAYYRVNGSSTWLGPVNIYRVRTTENSLFNGFAGWIVDLTAGVTYDVRVDVTQSGVLSTGTPATTATRTIPAENASPTGSGTAKTVTAGSASDLQSKLSGAVAGDVITIPAGTYSGNFTISNKVGTVANPITIRGADRETTILSGTANTVLTMSSCQNVVVENLTIRGSQTNGGGGAASHGIDITNATGVNPTFRHLSIIGVDQGIKAWGTDVNGFIAYDCEILGNNTWPATISEDDTGTHWNDTGIEMPGLGNSVWNCTFDAMGDTVKLTTGSGDTTRARSCYFHHNWIKSGFDDGFEFDDSDRNNAVYNNIFENTVTLASVDTLGGPIGFFRNVCINQMRHPFKINAGFTNFICVNNTIVNTNKKPSGVASGNYSLQCAAGSNIRLTWANNLINYAGSGGLALIGGSFPNSFFDYNAYYPSGRTFQFGQYGAFQAHDVVTAANPFGTAITLGADYQTRYVGHLDVTLASGSNARNAGIAWPGITDGFTGAAPDMGAIISGQTFGVVGCSFNVARPSWAENATVNVWQQISGTNLSALTYSPLPAGNIARKVDAWCSMSLDTRTSRLYQAAGGGHNDYAGNEVEVLDLTKETPGWATLLAPSSSQQNGSYYADGRPTSRHNYHGSHVNEIDNRIMLFGGAQYSSGAILNTVDSFNLSGNTYNPAGTHPNMPSGIVGAEVRPTCVDPRTGDVYVFGGSSSGSLGSVVKWTRSTNTMGAATSLGGGQADREACACWDSTRNVIVMIYSNTMRIYDPAGPSFTSVSITGASIPSPNSADFQGNSTVYVPALDAFLHYLGTGGGAVYKIDAATRVATNLGTTGGTSIASGAHGSWGRFRYVPQLRGVVYAPTHAGNVWFLRVH